MISYDPRANALDRAILALIAQTSGPIGQGVLSLRLQGQGFSMSTPTVGRRLQRLEFEGLLRKVGVDGRVITDRGAEVLRSWEDEARLRGSGEALLETLKRGDKKHLLDLLSARRVIEGETAALAAQYASPGMIRQMEAVLERQATSISRGGLGTEQDVKFHQLLARSSKNEVLHSIVALLRNHTRYNVVVTSMRTVVGGRLVVDHRAILDTVKAKDPQAARLAMDRHLRSLADDIDRYWARRMVFEADARGT